MNEIVAFEDSVKQRLKDIVADLIPEERWDAIVRATVREFEKQDLPKLVKAALAEQYKKAIVVEFAKEEWQGMWGSVGQEASPMLKKMLVEAAPLVFTEMIGASVQQVMINLQSQIQRY